MRLRRRNPSFRINRGQAAAQVAEDPVVRSALQYVYDHAIGAFKAAKSPNEAWLAHLEWEAAEMFAGFLRAAIADGMGAAAELRREHDKSVHDRQARATIDGYMEEARKARAEESA